MANDDAYSVIDPIIHAWSKAHSLKMFSSFGGRSERFCYISSHRGECFQIAIQPPQDAKVRVDAWSVETLDDRELHQEWVSEVTELQNALESALAQVHEWLGE